MYDVTTRYWIVFWGFTLMFGVLGQQSLLEIAVMSELMRTVAATVWIHQLLLEN